MTSQTTVILNPPKIESTPPETVALFQKKTAIRAGVITAPYTVYAAYAASKIRGKKEIRENDIIPSTTTTTLEKKIIFLSGRSGLINLW